MFARNPLACLCVVPGVLKQKAFRKIDFNLNEAKNLSETTFRSFNKQNCTFALISTFGFMSPDVVFRFPERISVYHSIHIPACFFPSLFPELFCLNEKKKIIPIAYPHLITNDDYF